MMPAPLAYACCSDCTRFNFGCVMTKLTGNMLEVQAPSGVAACNMTMKVSCLLSIIATEQPKLCLGLTVSLQSSCMTHHV